MKVVKVNAYVPEAPVPLARETPPGAEYPLEALGPLMKVVEAVTDVTQAPVALGAQSALGVSSLAAQGSANVETLSGVTPLSLNLLSVAQSGERKSTGDKILMRPVLDYLRELNDTYREEYATYKNRQEIWLARRKDIVKKAKEAGARADLDALGPEPEPPLTPLIIATDPAIEGITRELANYRPSLGIFSDEGGMFLGGSGMSDDNRQKTFTTLSSFWDGAPINRTRAGDGAVTHYDKRLSCHLMVQPVVAKDLLGDKLANGQGFLARFLITEPPSTIGTRLSRAPRPESQGVIDQFEQRIGEMLRFDFPLREGTRNELELPVLPLESDAKDLLRKFADEVGLAQGAGNDLEEVRPFASKAAEPAARIACVLTCFAEEASVSATMMAHAVELVNYYLGETKRLADAATLSRETQDAERLRKWLLESWTEAHISATDAVQWGPFRETRKVTKLLAMLAEFRWLIPVDDGAKIKGRHRREAFMIVRA